MISTPAAKKPALHGTPNAMKIQKLQQVVASLSVEAMEKDQELANKDQEFNMLRQMLLEQQEKETGKSNDDGVKAGKASNSKASA